MTIQNGARAPRGSACLEKAAAILPPRHLELIATASQAYSFLFAIRATSPHCAPAHRAWQEAAVALAVAIIKHAEQIGGRHE